MRDYKTTQVEKEMLVKVRCDWCSRKISNLKDSTIAGAMFELKFYYGSKHDCHTFKYDICDDCFDKHFPKRKSEVRSPWE